MCNPDSSPFRAGRFPVFFKPGQLFARQKGAICTHPPSPSGALLFFTAENRPFAPLCPAQACGNVAFGLFLHQKRPCLYNKKWYNGGRNRIFAFYTAPRRANGFIYDGAVAVRTLAFPCYFATFSVIYSCQRMFSSSTASRSPFPAGEGM